MGLIGIVLLVIMVISAVLLVLVVLVQDDQGEGIGGIFGGGSSSAFGSRSGNVLTRFTAVLAAVFLVTCFGMAWLGRTPTGGNVVSKARQEALGGGTAELVGPDAQHVRQWRNGAADRDDPADGQSVGAGSATTPAPAPKPAGTGGQ